MVLLDEDEEEEAIAASVKSRDEDRLSTLRMDLAEARQAQDVQRQIETLKAIGKIQVSQKMENEAIATYTELLNANEAAGDQSGILEMLDMLSALMTKTENLQAAVLHVTRGIELAEELDELETGMHLQTTLGDARQQLGESEDAIHAYGQALASARNRGDSQNEAIILYKLGYAQLDNNDVDSAVHTWEQALTLFKEQEKRDYEGRVLGGLGSAYGEMQRWAESINFHTSALHIAREVGDKEEEALQLSSLGQAGVQANQLPQALLRYRQALHLAYVSNDRDNIVSAIVDLVRLMLRSRRLLNICELLIDDALRLEPNDRDVTGLKARIASEKELAEQYQVVMAHISGSAQDYAANAYKLLDA
jgi:tetratricopeptide (TPR) repeat protein